MNKPGKKIRKKRFDKLKAPDSSDKKKNRSLLEAEYDEVGDFETDYEYEADDEEYEDVEEELASEFLELGI